MSASLVEKIANAVLYEGYLLYPYRSSAVKNRQRWNFGVVYPRPYSEMRKGIEPCEMETQCLAEGTAATRLAVKVRCLRLVDRVVGYLGEGAEPAFAPAASIEIDGVHYESWQEAAECEMVVPVADFGDLCAGMVRCGFDLPASRAVEEVRDSSQRLAGLIVRTQEPLQCRIEISLLAIQDDLFQIGVRIANDTPYVVREPARETVMAQSLLSAHTILHVENGEFVSLLEPPPQFEKAASACRNVGTWPVLAGEPGCRDTLLSSPIILYDYPQIAPESPGDLFDGAEIDEILSLRILTLTDEEKLAMRSSDERARRILERTEALPPEHFMKLHGVLRGVPPAETGEAMNEWEWQLLEDKTPIESVTAGGVELRQGARVRLRPRPGGDIFDMALAGKIAIIESIEQDYEGKPHLAVVLEDDPGRDLGMMRQPGHRFFFSPDEVEPAGHGELEP